MKRFIYVVILCFAIGAVFVSGCERETARPEPTTEALSSTDVTNDEGATEDVAATLPEEDYEMDARVLFLYPGDRVDYPITFSGKKDKPDLTSFRWVSSDPEVAEVDEEGRILGLKKGSALISCDALPGEDAVCVNVVNSFGTGPSWDLDVLTGPDQHRTYRNYAQGAYDYDAHDDYLAMHGCAVCCATTIIRAWYPEEDWTPDRVMDELESEASPEDYEKNYAKSVRRQMPLTLKGISRVFTLKDIPHTYVTEFDEKTLIEDLTGYLKDGKPIVFEAGNGGYHMLLLLGVMPNGDFVLSNSVGMMRVNAVPPEKVKKRLFSCTKEPVKSYFAGRKTAGGYIVVE